MLKMKRMAVALLLAMLALFILANLGMRRVPDWNSVLEWVRVFAEAAMVGALADWFAVVALFRHPLGIAIPHTAILPSRKKEIASSLGAFIVNNFLERETVRTRIQKVDFMGFALRWVKPQSTRIAQATVRFLPRFLDLLDKQAVADFLHTRLQRHIESLPLAPLSGKILDVFISSGKHELLLDEALLQCRELLNEHQTAIREGIEEEIPLPAEVFGFSLKSLRAPIAEYVAQKLVSRVLVFLEEAGNNREHAMRKRFTQRTMVLIQNLKNSEEYRAKGELWKRDFLSKIDLRSYVETVWREAREWLRSQVDAPNEKLTETLALFLHSLIELLETDQALVHKCNHWARETAGELVQTHRKSFGKLIEDTINAWDAVELSQKIEREIGGDLQFIRINGTLIGGLAGILIHLVGLLVH